MLSKQKIKMSSAFWNKEYFKTFKNIIFLNSMLTGSTFSGFLLFLHDKYSHPSKPKDSYQWSKYVVYPSGSVSNF